LPNDTFILVSAWFLNIFFSSKCFILEKELHSMIAGLDDDTVDINNGGCGDTRGDTKISWQSYNNTARGNEIRKIDEEGAHHLKSSLLSGRYSTICSESWSLNT